MKSRAQADSPISPSSRRHSFADEFPAFSSGRVLVASCSTEARRSLRFALECQGYEAGEGSTAEQIVEEAASERYDLMILDSALEGAAVYQLCRAIRQHSNLGIIVLGRETGGSSIDALNAGADDYVPPPLVMGELLARVRALRRRVPPDDEDRRRVVLHDRAIDMKAHKVRGPEGRVSHLTPKEFLVLRYLLTHANEPRTHQSLAQTVWQRDGSGELEYVRIVIKQLRRKLEPDPDNPQYILTERSVGYRFRLP